LSGRERTRVDALSHGNQQRAQLAVALVHDPRLLVLDEPFSGLDPGGIDDMSAILLIAVALAVALPPLLSGHSSGPDRTGVVGGSPAVSGIVAEAGQLSGGSAVAVSEPSLAAAKTALADGSVTAVLVPGQQILVEQVPLGGVSGSVATLSQLAGLARLVQTDPAAAAAVEHGVTLPVRGLKPPSKSLASRLTGLATVVVVWVLISVYGSQIALGIGEEKPSRVVEVQLPLIVAYALSCTVLYANGSNAFYDVLAFLPTAPIAMPVLYAAGDVPVWQVVVSALLCAAGTVAMARLAVRIYANSLLRTGARIKLGQAIRESRKAA
jgi:ABC-type Na+ efflux pump permease subunit